jgi:hypothetical protein
MTAASRPLAVRLRSGDVVRLRQRRLVTRRLWPGPKRTSAPCRCCSPRSESARFVRLVDRRDTADLAVTVVDAWQGRGLGSALRGAHSERALGIEYFTAEILVETESRGPAVGPASRSLSRPGRLSRGSAQAW